MYAEMGVIFTAVSKINMAYITLVAAVSMLFFCNVTSLGIVCIRRGKTIKFFFFAILWPLYIIHVLQCGSFWVNYFGASLFLY